MTFFIGISDWNVSFFNTYICRRFHVWIATLQTAAMIAIVFGQYQHRAVLTNDAFEAALPLHYRNQFIRTPRVREFLAKSSWFAAGEQPVKWQIDLIIEFKVLLSDWFIPKLFFRCLNEKRKKSIAVEYTLCSHMPVSFQDAPVTGLYWVDIIKFSSLKKTLIRFISASWYIRPGRLFSPIAYAISPPHMMQTRRFMQCYCPFIFGVAPCDRFRSIWLTDRGTLNRRMLSSNETNKEHSTPIHI